MSLFDFCCFSSRVNDCRPYIKVARCIQRSAQYRRKVQHEYGAPKSQADRLRRQAVLRRGAWRCVLKQSKQSKAKMCNGRRHVPLCAACANEKYAVQKCSAVTIIVVTIFIATFQNYRIVFLSRYLLCVRNDIFARYLRYANMIDSPPVYSSFSFNHMPRTT